MRNFRWLSNEKLLTIDREWILKQEDDQSTGFVFEVDLDYPSEIHDEHASYPLAPHHQVIDHTFLSEYSKECLDKIHLTNPKSYKAKKLIASLMPRRNYVVHYGNLKLYLELGMIITKIHRAVSFTQTPFLGQYIDHCTKRRAASRTVFGKNRWKLMCNANFGKFIEGVRERSRVRFIFKEEQALRATSDPFFQSMKRINDGFSLAFLKNKTIVLSKPYAIGFTILEVSKHFMYDQFYKKIRPKFDECHLVMTDTDSLVLRVKTAHGANPLHFLKDSIDFSNYPSESPYYNETNKNAPGYWKDELTGKTLERFIGK